MNLSDLKESLMASPDYKKFKTNYDLSFEISDMIIRARIEKGLSQEKLAKLIKSSQPNIARIENGSHLPSLKTLEKIARVLDSYLIAPKFAFLESPITPHHTSRADFKQDDAITTRPTSYFYSSSLSASPHYSYPK